MRVDGGRSWGKEIVSLNGMRNEWQQVLISVALVFLDNVRKRRAGKLKHG
jgi:hypothetical protein